MEEWSFFVAKTVQQQILLKERSPLCMLPSPLNLITTAVAPLHYPLMRQGVSLAGSIADRMLAPLGQIQTYFFLLYLYVKGLPKFVVTCRLAYNDYGCLMLVIVLVTTVPLMVCSLSSSLSLDFILMTTR